MKHNGNLQAVYYLSTITIFTITIPALISQAAQQCQHRVNGDSLKIGKWQNLTPHKIKTHQPIAKNCHG